MIIADLVFNLQLQTALSSLLQGSPISSVPQHKRKGSSDLGGPSESTSPFGSRSYEPSNNAASSIGSAPNSRRQTIRRVSTVREQESDTSRKKGDSILVDIGES